MTKALRTFVLILCIFLAGCSDIDISKYDNDEVAAIVKGHEITVGDLRFLYPDESALNYLDLEIKFELVKQEVKEMNLNITEFLNEQRGWLDELPPANTKNEAEKDIRKFAESQAKKFDMAPEEYYQKFEKIMIEQGAYFDAYLENQLGKIESNHENALEEFISKVEGLLEKLVEENEDEIIVFIE